MRVFATVPQNDLRLVAGRGQGGSRPRGMTASSRWRTSTTRFSRWPSPAWPPSGSNCIPGSRSVFARTPMATAEVGWDLAGSTGGRFVIGLGSQVQGA